MFLSRLRSHIPDAAAWDSFVARHPQGHILQLPAWGDLKQRFGWTGSRIALADDSGSIVAGAQILYRRLPFRLGTMAYIPKGPLTPIEWWGSPAQMQPLWEAIRQAARQHGARWLKVEAPDQIGPSLPSEVSV